MIFLLLLSSCFAAKKARVAKLITAAKTEQAKEIKIITDIDNTKRAKLESGNIDSNINKNVTEKILKVDRESSW